MYILDRNWTIVSMIPIICIVRIPFQEENKKV